MGGVFVEERCTIKGLHAGTKCGEPEEENKA
jgi:hypothetical protein